MSDLPGPPAPATSLATVCLSGTLERKLHAAAGAGFDAVEIFDADLLACPWTPAEVRARAADLGLAIALHQPVRDLEAVPPEVFARNLRRAEQKLDVAAALGAPTVLVCSSTAPDALDDDDLAAEQLAAVADLAAARGLRLAYEALAWGRHVSDYRHSADVVRRAGHPALGICLDSFHILSRGDDPSGIRDLPGDLIAFVQLADAPLMRLDVLQWSRRYRCFPGQGGFDLVGFAGHLQAAGYRGPWSLEVFNDVFRAVDPHRTARDAQRSLRHLLQQVAGVPQPRPTSVQFVEVAPGTRTGTGAHELPATLTALGFARAGVHRSKPVELWTRDGVDVVLHPAGTPQPPRAGTSASVVAVGLGCADVERSAEQAVAVLAEPLERAVGPEEARLVELPAPDGSTVLLADDSADWRADFAPAPGAPGRLPAQRAGTRDLRLLGVDHVSVTVPPARFDEAVLHYRAVLGMDVGERQEVPGTHGLVRSCAAATPDGSVRVVVNAQPPGTAGDGNPGRAVQHVAFACTDVLAAAEEFLARGGRLLRIPGNYYDDLRARTDLPPEVVDRMERLGVLHDADGGGAFLHCYTEPVGEHLLVELCQRTGSYAGFGTQNAAVRLAAVERVRQERAERFDRRVGAQDRRAGVRRSP
ncbi:sugar phosphate isomerase/epimerase and 4-hydroxyphenylpyruvate domain-containing protein [Kineococcus sp. NUM-3379]